MSMWFINYSLKSVISPLKFLNYALIRLTVIPLLNLLIHYIISFPQIKGKCHQFQMYLLVTASGSLFLHNGVSVVTNAEEKQEFGARTTSLFMTRCC